MKEVSNLINLPVVNLLGTRVDGTSVEVVPKRINLKLPATTTESGISARIGIWAPTEVVKKVCQRLADQVSSLRFVVVSANLTVHHDTSPQI